MKGKINEQTFHQDLQYGGVLLRDVLSNGTEVWDTPQFSTPGPPK